MCSQMGVHVSDGCSSSAYAFAEELAVCNYQVFRSFRGPDVRHNFIDYFYNHLTNLGFMVFKDREEIDHGDRIDTKIVEAIDRSEICIPVLSKDFASSAACLMEVAQMVKSKKTILPIFFGVKPCVVRHQQGTYGDSFVKHEKRIDTETITEWKTALANIAENLGFELEDVRNEHDNLIRAVISKLWQLLKMDQEVVTGNLVGIDSGVREMMQKLGVNYQDGQVVEGQKMTGSCVVAVCGLRGVGKTTLAKEVYNRIKHLFDACSFLEGVREAIEHRGLVPLQNQLIKDLKGRKISKVESSYQGTKTIKRSFQRRSILIVLDDVDDFEQIKPLAEKLTWFGSGSRIILTIRSKDVIKHYEVREIKEHEVSPMNKNHALELLCKHTFQQDHPPEGYGSLPSEITFAVGELPFAIEIVGSRLKGQQPEIWRETLDKLKGEPDKRVKVLLKESYGLLDSDTREIFLDIACFFAGVEKTMPFYMWEAQHRFPNLGLHELQNMSFLKIGEENEFRMNNQLKILGREIVKEEDLKNPGKRSRLWDYKDVQITLQERKCTSG